MGKKEQQFVTDIIPREEDFYQWYTDVILKADLVDYAPVRGCMVIKPYGYGIWENIQKELDRRFKETGHENAYFPLLIPESLLRKEAEHVEGFAPEVAWVTHGGNEELGERLVVRPTSETIICAMYSKWIQSYRDLPILYNQWCSVVRWEKTTRPFLRTAEFLWQEGHTAHATEEEAREETLQMLDIYKDLGKEVLAIPFITGRKTEREKFAGAIETYTIEALMYDGKALQSGTSHYFGQEFSKAFDITFQNKDSKLEHVYQTSWGVSTRLIGAVIMVHGDDEGLVLPPYVAPDQVVIIPIQGKNSEVVDVTNNLFDELKAKGIRVKLDDSNRSPGWKFSEYEMKGVPLRIEIGPRDIKNVIATVVKRHNREKLQIPLKELSSKIPEILKEVHEEMYEKALDHVEKNIRIAKTYDEFKAHLDLGGYVKLSISGEKAEEIIKEDTGATARAIVEEDLVTEICPVTNEKATQTILFARAY